ncbi:polysaccharide biosynthesis protein [Candidatus Wolfebacteria bacterium]|nr:polysaccharide biosynthesis protein [Candidatus Wolfebacteria bacterium]
MNSQKLKDFFLEKKILVTGGTGSFGNQVISRLVEFKPESIIVFSRDEDKQYWLQKKFEEHKNILNFIIGDIRDYNRLSEAMNGVNIVYHAAALKHVPSNELHPMEAVKTNILGAENVRRTAIENNVDIVVDISTDKAAKPVSVMGMTKAIQERIFLAPTNIKNTTRFVCVRYGNVIGSRGSVIPFFRERIEQGKSLPITSKKMTRFLIRLEEAIDSVFYATLEQKSGSLIVRKMPACFINDLAEVMAEELTGRSDYPIEEVGIRPGEKINEILISEEEMRRMEEKDDHYIVNAFIESEKLNSNDFDIIEYDSRTTNILNKKEIAALLRKDGWLDPIN